MHFSIYNDNRIDTKSFIATNLIKSSHFPWTVRTPPNCYKNYFIGELTKRVKPRFDIDLTNSSIFISTTAVASWCLSRTMSTSAGTAPITESPARREPTSTPAVSANPAPPPLHRCMDP